ncbi:hypothetical protein DFH07DRAFT_813172 [Mycena maculata]|uniref:Uncharacterized protein n=1 Tax=Mycena maculata TaxID=230809 RepID=A0AAD7JEM4_9AGAR|nr:hypothetical protein DFH07DRAFT_813172 [Mycena maculata]
MMALVILASDRHPLGIGQACVGHVSGMWQVISHLPAMWWECFTSKLLYSYWLPCLLSVVWHSGYCCLVTCFLTLLSISVAPVFNPCIVLLFSLFPAELFTSD